MSNSDADKSEKRESERSLRSVTAGVGRSYPVIVAVAVVVGLAIAPFAWQFGAGTTDRVAVVPIAGDIDGENTADVAERLGEVRNDPSVKGVVLVVDSPGGVAAPSEELYMEVTRTAEEMPVVATVGAAATSGAYYAIAPADEIYVKPSSTVGSIGVFAMMPEQVGPLDEVIQSGPDKLSGDTERSWEHNVETMKNAFVASILEHRDGDIELDRTELERASVYTGIDAVENGLADEIGGVQAGVQAVADRADLDEYEVDERQYDVEVRFLTEATYHSADVPEKELIEPERYADRTVGGSTPIVLMFPAEAIVAAEAEAETEVDDE